MYGPQVGFPGFGIRAVARQCRVYPTLEYEVRKSAIADLRWRGFAARLRGTAKGNGRAAPNKKPAGEAGFSIHAMRGDYIFIFEQSLFGHST